MAGLEEEDYEDAADFLEMAARLIYIKTVSLLPVDNEGEELKKELEGSLIEYSLCKMAAAKLAAMYAGGDIFVRRPMEIPINKTYQGTHNADELFEAYMGIGEKAKAMKPLRAEIFKPLVSKHFVSVTSKIIHVLKKLYTKGECALEGLYEGSKSKSERVAVFLAVLELTKSGRIFLNEDNTKVFMNSACKNRRIRSDFDNAEAPAPQQNESEKAENISISAAGGSDGNAENTLSTESNVSAESMSDSPAEVKTESIFEDKKSLPLEELAEKILSKDKPADICRRESSDNVSRSESVRAAVTLIKPVITTADIPQEKEADELKHSEAVITEEAEEKIKSTDQTMHCEEAEEKSEMTDISVSDGISSDDAAENETSAGEIQENENAAVTFAETVTVEEHTQEYEEAQTDTSEETHTEEYVPCRFRPNYYGCCRYYWGYGFTADCRRYGIRL